MISHEVAADIDLSAVERSALEVLAANDRGTHIVPSGETYPHLWLWDSAFHAIGLAHLDPIRAGVEVTAVLDSQWDNGMVPHMTFSPKSTHPRTGQTRRTYDHLLWHRKDNQGRWTSGITQPPILAEATQRAGHRMQPDDRRAFYSAMIPKLVKYHEWFYDERGDETGLVATIHPWETGLDNTPPWMEHLRDVATPAFSMMSRAPIEPIVRRIRRDTRELPADQRSTVEESILALGAIMRLRRNGYDAARIKDDSRMPRMHDAGVNSIFVRNNTILVELAEEAGCPLSDQLLANMRLTEQGLESLRDVQTGLYRHRDLRKNKLVENPTIAGVLPLYAGTIAANHAIALHEKLADPDWFGTSHPVPSVPKNSPYFEPSRYWSGPSWVNTNWLIIDGAERSGQPERASRLRLTTLALTGAGMYEYFSSEGGHGCGAPNFSWTAALALDLARTEAATAKAA